MANLLLLMAIILAGASFTSFTAAKTVADSDAPNWATHMCTTAPYLCHYPQQTAYVAVGLAGLWVLMKFLSAVSD